MIGSGNKTRANGLLAALPTSADPNLVEKYVCVTPEGAWVEGGMLTISYTALAGAFSSRT